MYRVTKWHFHWKFWEPKQCTGGPVYLGRWATVSPGRWDTGEVKEQSAGQVSVKRSMGMISY